MRRAVLWFFSVTLILFFISACVQPTRVDRHYGKSVNQAKLNQILHREGEKDLEPVTGLDGKSAQASIEKYRKTFEQPREAPPPTIQTGTPVSNIGK